MNYTVTDVELTSIANAIRQRGSTSELLTWESGYTNAVLAIPVPSGSISISANDSYDVTAFSNAVVNVSGGGNDNFLIAIGAKGGSIYDTEASEVGGYAFWQRSSYQEPLTGAEMVNVTKIGANAFASCTSLTYVSFPNCSLISNEAFRSCTALSSVYFPICSVISAGAFSTCSSLTAVSFPICSIIDYYAFGNCRNLVSVSFPECKSISALAFTGCSSLVSVDFPSCAYIDLKAFQNCINLVSANFPVCWYTDTAVFSYCYRLTDISLPACQIIGQSAFQSCSALSTIVLPVCSSIGSYAFIRCISLERVCLLSTSIVYMRYSIFSSTPILHSSYLGHYGSIYVPSSLVDAYKADPEWRAYSDRITAYVE